MDRRTCLYRIDIFGWDKVLILFYAMRSEYKTANKNLYSYNLLSNRMVFSVRKCFKWAAHSRIHLLGTPYSEIYASLQCFVLATTSIDVMIIIRT